jgi:hypothetical protein
MALPFAVSRRSAVVSAAGALAGLAAITAIHTAPAAGAARTTAAAALGSPPASHACPMCTSGGYVIIVRHEGMLAGMLDRLL